MKSILLLGLVASVQAGHSLHQPHSGSLTKGSRGSTISNDALQATATASCKNYTVKSGDTCSSIGKSTGATWAQLISWNSEINNKCSNLDSFVGKSICVSNPMGNYGMPTNTIGTSSASATGTGTVITTTAPIPSPTLDGTNARCGGYYKIRANENCATVEEKFEISKSDFLFLNPEVFTNCTNLEKDVYYCVEPVGYISTYPGYGGSTTSTPAFSMISMTDVPFPTQSYSSGGHPVIPVANGTRKDCTEYAWFDKTQFPGQEVELDCWNIAMFYDITREEFILWNPSMAKNGTRTSSSSKPLIALVTATPSASPTASPTALPSFYDYPCTVSQSTSYCVAISTPTST